MKLHVPACMRSANASICLNILTYFVACGNICGNRLRAHAATEV